MDKKILTIVILLVLLFISLVKADVPPDKGKVRVSIPLVTQTTQDLSDFRFFLEFYGDLREVEIKSNGRTEIPAMGGGARYSSGTFLAIPKKNLSGFDAQLSNEQLEDLSAAIKKKEALGVVELAKHHFSADIPTGDEPPEVYYDLKREGETIRAEQISKQKANKNLSELLVSTGSRSGYIIGGILVALAALSAGIFAFRKVSRKV